MRFKQKKILGLTNELTDERTNRRTDRRVGQNSDLDYASVTTVWKTPVCKRGVCKQGILKCPVSYVLKSEVGFMTKLYLFTVPKMRLIQSLKFRKLKTGCFKMPRLQAPRLQTGVFQTGITVASGIR